MSRGTIRPAVPPPRPIVYPDSDGKPMSDNTEQFDYIVDTKLGLEWLYADRVDVFVAGDLLWYPVEGNNKIRIGPDVLVAFGRPKGRRGSYMQWLEGGISPHVVFEIMSPKNTLKEMARKLAFYDLYGVEEFYRFDPNRAQLKGWRRVDGVMTEIKDMNGWVSPRLDVRFELADGKMVLHGPDSRPFRDYVEVSRTAELQKQRADRLAAKLRALGVDPEQ